MRYNEKNKKGLYVQILIINGHPNQESLSAEIVQRYYNLASKKADVCVLNLSELDFNFSLQKGYKQEQILEDCLKNAQKMILNADKLVFVYPCWWGSMPTLLKGFIDRVFIPGFAFKYHKNQQLPQKLLKSKKADIIVSMDAPYLYYKYIQGAGGDKIMKNSILEFCGIKPVRFLHLDKIKGSSSKRIEKLLKKVEDFATN